MQYTVNELAKLSGVSVRTLHYYDEIGLLKPAVIAVNGYRYYGQKEIVQLQQILFYRELDFSLEDIKKIILSSKFNRVAAFKDQRKLLLLKKERLENIIKTIDTEVQNLEGGENMTNDDMFGSLSDKQLKEHAEEAKRRWGDTEAYKQSVERTKNWTKEDYKRVEKESKELTSSIAKVMKKGTESPEVQTLIEKHYQSINQFYDCPLEMYKNLGEMYITDPRFTAYYEKFAPGLAKFMKDAIAYYCKTNEVK